MIHQPLCRCRSIIIIYCGFCAKLFGDDQGMMTRWRYIQSSRMALCLCWRHLIISAEERPLDAENPWFSYNESRLMRHVILDAASILDCQRAHAAANEKRLLITNEACNISAGTRWLKFCLCMSISHWEWRRFYFVLSAFRHHLWRRWPAEQKRHFPCHLKLCRSYTSQRRDTYPCACMCD